MGNNVQDSINKAIDVIVEKRVNALALDKTVIGVIDSVIDSASGIYKVKYDGGYFNAESQSGAVFPKGMSVYIQVPQNDMTKKKFIIGRASDLRESERANVVISSLNNYAILGNSVISPKNESIGEGLYSYHSEDTEKRSKEPHPITHRAKLIYSNKETLDTHYILDLNALNLYKENATALMIEAEFRTSFDSNQRYDSTGVYGIGLNLSFENSNYQYGSTQGEIFKYFAPQVKASIERYDDETQKEINTKISMQDIDEKIREALDALDDDELIKFKNLIKQDGILDKYLAYANSLIFTYSSAAPATYLPEEDAIMQSYLVMLSDLKNIAISKKQVQTYYKGWKEKVIENPIKQVSYVLDSNSMTGNPFSFTSWSTQYAIFDIDFEHFQSIDSVLFYKQGFKTSPGKEDERGEDIFVRNLKIYALQPISAINGDYRLELQTPDGLIFKTLSETEILTITGKATKAYYEDLSDNAIYYWFKKNPNVTTVSHALYHQFGGISWEYIGGPDKKGNSKTISLSGKENTAYKNKYKCVCLIDDVILLKDEFTLYNEAADIDIEINSDLGQSFSFDAGSPLLTCLLKLKDQKGYQEYTDKTYQYIWNVTVDDITTSFEPNYLNSLESIKWDENSGTYIQTSQSSTPSIANAMRGPIDGDIINIIQNVQFYKGEDLITSFNDLLYATRIKYPISNLAAESVVTFTCHVLKEEKNLGEATIALQNQGHPQITSYRLILENGEQVFQYDEYGNPPNSPKLKSPQEIKPVIPHLLSPAGVEVASKNYRVQWTLPIENTLIIPNATLGINPYDDRKNSLDNNPQCSFKIAESYNEDYLNNQINCRVIINDEIIQANTDFYFGKVGSNGTNGTDMVAKIVPAQNKQILNTQPVILYRYNDGEKIISIFNTGTINNPDDIFLANSDSSKNRIFKAKLYQKNEEIPEEEEGKKNFTVRWNIAGNPQTTVNNFSKYIELGNNPSSLSWKENFNQDTKNKKFLPIYTIRAQITHQNKDYYAFYSFPVIYYYSSTLPVYNRIAINKSSLLKEIVYNADGRNPVYNHNQGVEIINVPEGCTISWYAYGGKNNNETTADFKLLLERNGKNKKEVAETKFSRTTNNFIYVLPNDEYDGSNTNNRIVAYISKDSTNIAVVTVPLHMSLNTFGLASLNAWDGNTVTIDEDNGYVMAPQVGAGEKDSNNRFTGILMGKTETYTGASKNEVEIGLFGYAHGLQSIFLDSNTGSAYFGLPDVQTTFDEDGNPKSYNYAHSTIRPKNNGDDYNEGRVELIPGGMSKVGGWRLGRRSLYYIEDNMEVGQRYSDTVSDDLGPVNPPKYISYGDYIPDKTGAIKHSDESAYSAHHEKDIPHGKAGILIHSGSNPYISIKGRTLDPKGRDKGLLDDGSDSYLQEGDSLEIELDPQAPAVFSIFRHNGAARKKTDSNDEEKIIYEKNSRTFLAGINGKGQLVANGLQSSSNNDNSTVINDTVTTFGIDKVGAFKEDLSVTHFVGFKMFAGANAVAKLFVSDPAKSSTNTLYLTGGTSSTNEYERPISIHGQKISLYARDNDADDTSIPEDKKTSDWAKTQRSKIIIDSSQFYGGNENSSHIYLPAKGAADITTMGSNTIKGFALDLIATSDTGSINLKTKNGSNTKSHLELLANGSASLLGATSCNFTAYNGSVNLWACDPNKINKDNENGKTSWLTLVQNGDSTLRGYNGIDITGLNNNVTITSGADTTITAGGSFNLTAGGTGNGLYLPVASILNKNAHLQSVRPLDISSMGGLNIKANNNSNGNNGNLKTESALSTSVKAGTSLTVQTGAAISIRTDGDQPGNIITITNTKYDPPVNGNTLSVSTKIGGFRIQKTGDTYKSNLLNMIITKKEGEKDVIDSERSLGVNATFGYFRDTIGPENATDGSKNNSVWAKGRYITNDYGAEGYAFAKEDTIGTDYDYTITGFNIESLLEGILKALRTEVNGLNNAISVLAGRVSTAEGKISTLESKVSTLETNIGNKVDKSTYNYHTHKYWKPTGGGSYSGTANVDTKTGHGTSSGSITVDGNNWDTGIVDNAHQA